MHIRLRHCLFAMTAVMFGCATSQDLAGVRQNVQKEMQEMRAQSEAKQKAAEELQVHIVKAFEAQAHTLASLSDKVRELQVLQDALQKERVASQGANATLRDAIVRSLKAEQSDLQQRLRATTDYLKEIEQAGSVGSAVPPPPVSTQSEKNQAEGPPAKGLNEPPLGK
ncbi:hypothetical protein [Nitrospira lenta]|uniref:Uncharacterized protein n=1 Tax=Nitrospira lenta TaxID=1436998 RepID=A0A330KZY9_9BACT|nr:hypothetical protein [Nitrospira lenta]SPP62954.1 exported hypothetical protein [Nitrospira lenta]